MNIICKRSGNNYLTSYEVMFEDGEKVTVLNYGEFIENFKEFTHGIFDENFNWDNVVTAGGCPLQCLLTKKNKYYDTSDVDLFIYGTTEKEKSKKFDYLILFFNSFGARFSFCGSSVLNVIIPGLREFQIVYTNCATKEQVIQEFDADYIKVLFDGKDIHCTSGFLQALETQTTNIFTNTLSKNTHIKRYMKALDKGFSIKMWNDSMDLCEDYLSIKDSKEIVDILKRLPTDLIGVISSYCGYDNKFLNIVGTNDGYDKVFNPEFVIDEYRNREEEKEEINFVDSETVFKLFKYQPLQAFSSYHSIDIKENRKVYFFDNIFLDTIYGSYNQDGKNYGLIFADIDFQKVEDMYNDIFEDNFFKSIDNNKYIKIKNYKRIKKKNMEEAKCINPNMILFKNMIIGKKCFEKLRKLKDKNIGLIVTPKLYKSKNVRNASGIYGGKLKVLKVWTSINSQCWLADNPNKVIRI